MSWIPRYLRFSATTPMLRSLNSRLPAASGRRLFPRPSAPGRFLFGILVFAGLIVSACQTDASSPRDSSSVSDMRIKADWAAWVNKMPPGPPSFHVEGTLHMPHPGFEATLMPSRPQGVNPKVLMMDLKVKELDGMWAQVLTDIPVKYVEDPYEGDYEQVHIFYPNGDSVFLELTVAH